MGDKIVFIINTLNVGGAAKMLRYVANIATEIFDSVFIICIYDTYIKRGDLKSEIDVVGLGFEKINRLKRQFTMIGALKRTIKESSPKYVCAFIGHVNVMARIATIGMKDIIMMSAERGDPYTQPLLWRWLTKWAYRKSDYCFFQLEKARDFFGEKIRTRSFVIPNPFITSYPVSPYFGIRKKTIVSAGRFGFEKCYNDLIEAFSIVHTKHPQYELIIYGDGPMLTSYKEQVKRLRLENHVSFPGYVKSVAKEIEQDGIFVLSSQFEGIPNSLIEAMSIGIPCIATDCTPGGPNFLLKNQERGILVNVHDTVAMAKAICFYIENPMVAKEKGSKAVEVVEEFKESNIHNMWINAFQTIKHHE